MKTLTENETVPRRRAFTLIELLVVISIIGILAGFAFGVLGGAKRQQYIKAAGAELQQVESALENYKAKYGSYPPGNAVNPMLSQLYYELVGTTNNGVNYVTLDGASTILVGSVSQAYGVGGFINCSKGSGEDAAIAKNFLTDLKANRTYYPVTNNSYGQNIPTTVLITSAGGPDPNYQPLNAPGLNPFRYVYPGVNNPNSYDLWIDLSIKGKTNRISNWSRAVQLLN
jgi:prepilin-type N-terminal cleavage/methylation domain-containing protein